MKKTLIGIVVVIVLIGGWMLLRSGNKDEIDSTNMAIIPAVTNTSTSNVVVKTSTTTASSTSPIAKAVRSFTVLGSNYAFAPKQLLAKKGDTVTITFQNQTGFHDFKIDAFKVATKQIAAGKSETVTFVASKSGTFEYYCSVGNHRAMGMVGTLTVTE